jgi:hypothetical protein
MTPDDEHLLMPLVTLTNGDEINAISGLEDYVMDWSLESETPAVADFPAGYTDGVLVSYELGATNVLADLTVTVNGLDFVMDQSVCEVDVRNDCYTNCDYNYPIVLDEEGSFSTSYFSGGDDDNIGITYGGEPIAENYGFGAPDVWYSLSLDEAASLQVNLTPQLDGDGYDSWDPHAWLVVVNDCDPTEYMAPYDVMERSAVVEPAAPAPLQESGSYYVLEEGHHGFSVSYLPQGDYFIVVDAWWLDDDGYCAENPLEYPCYYYTGGYNDNWFNNAGFYDMTVSVGSPID